MIFRRKSIKLNRGFSLAELIIVAGIFIVITSIALIRQSKFSSDILVTNIAYEVALGIREAQVYGISSKQYEDAGTFSTVAYGMHFNSSNQTEITLFRDTPDANNDYDHIYESSTDGSPEAVTVFNQGHKIRRFCVFNSNWHCSDGINGQVAIDNLDISFIKPNPEAHIKAHLSGDTSYSDFTKMIVVVQSSLGDKCRVVEALEIGQVSVKPIVDGHECDTDGS